MTVARHIVRFGGRAQSARCANRANGTSRPPRHAVPTDLGGTGSRPDGNLTRGEAGSHLLHETGTGWLVSRSSGAARPRDLRQHRGAEARPNWEPELPELGAPLRMTTHGRRRPCDSRCSTRRAASDAVGHAGIGSSGSDTAGSRPRAGSRPSMRRCLLGQALPSPSGPGVRSVARCDAVQPRITVVSRETSRWAGLDATSLREAALCPRRATGTCTRETDGPPATMSITFGEATNVDAESAGGRLGSRRCRPPSPRFWQDDGIYRSESAIGRNRLT